MKFQAVENEVSGGQKWSFRRSKTKFISICFLSSNMVIYVVTEEKAHEKAVEGLTASSIRNFIFDQLKLHFWPPETSFLHLRKPVVWNFIFWQTETSVSTTS